MNNVDKQYLDLIRDILENGSYKETRAGVVKSVFGRQMRFNLKEGLPLLTTKKVYVKGIIHELLWFLNGDTNIKYLVDNNVHIWDDDSYRDYLQKVKIHNELLDKRNEMLGNVDNIPYNAFTYEYCHPKHNDLNVGGSIMFFNDDELEKELNNETDLVEDENDGLIELKDYAMSLNTIIPLTKEEYINEVKNESYCPMFKSYNEEYKEFILCDYVYGDCGKIYGHQWRNQGIEHVDQIQNIINLLKTNPNDRRMLCMAWNSNDMNEMILPPCHYGFQVYTRKLTQIERLEWLCEHSNGEYDEWKSPTKETLDVLGVPERELSLMWMQRSCDLGLGFPFNLLSYSILLSMIAQCVNMACGDVICSLGDVHIYENHIEGLTEQLNRNPNKYNLPKLELNPKVKNINDFTFEDIKIIGYESYPTIKLPLSVGL